MTSVAIVISALPIAERPWHYYNYMTSVLLISVIIDFFHLKADTLAALCNFDNILNITKDIDVRVAKPQST